MDESRFDFFQGQEICLLPAHSLDKYGYLMGVKFPEREADRTAPSSAEG
jgi:hypothetical protein